MSFHNVPDDAVHLNLLPPNCSEYNSHSNDFRISQSTYSYRQPIMNPHKRFLNRNESKCPSNLSLKQRKKWLKNGQKARDNQHLLSSMDHFYSCTTSSDPPVHIHHRISADYLQGLLFKIANVHLFTIDTESDKPTRERPYSVPALIQIQAIHDEHSSTIFIIELQHLPHYTTPLFRLIQTLCHQIFSSTNTIMAWGDILKELRPFEQFNLFDLSEITKTVNLQTKFSRYWNVTHPHTQECLARHQPEADEPEPDDILVCLVNSDDLDNEFDSMDITSDYNSCICSNEIRPYKSKNSLWSLQRAIQFVFHKALNKALTLNFWSCGLDTSLNTWHNAADKYTRASLITYAINDILAPTDLHFYMINSPIQSNPIPQQVDQTLPIFLILGDSNAKYFPPVVVTPTYKLITKSISGLQWIHYHNPELCTRSLLDTQSISSILSLCTGVFFFIGTNSVRTTDAPQIIQQIDEIIDVIRFHHSHLVRKEHISISLPIPCLNISRLFPTPQSLLANIQHYAYLLNNLSLHKDFNIVHLPITPGHLRNDGMHIHVSYLPALYDFIQQYINNIVIIFQTANIQVKNRSTEAKKRRNQKQHDKQRQRQVIHTVVRRIARVWPLHELKAYLQFKNIKYGRLGEIRNHKLKIRFNHPLQQQHAEHSLALHEFNEQNYSSWILRTR